MKTSEVTIGNSVITIVPTTHVDKESGMRVQKTIEEIDPDIVAVELCESRFNAMKEKREKGEVEIVPEGESITIKDLLNLIKKPRTLVGVLILGVGHVIQTALKRFNNVGDGDSDLEKALSTSSNNEKTVALIDQKIEVTISKVINKISLRETLKLIGSTIKSFVTLGYKMIKYRNNRSNIVNEENQLSKMDKWKQDFPVFYKTLVSDRNKTISHKLRWLAISEMKPNKTEDTIEESDVDSEREPYKIVAVMGSGHQEGVMEILTDENDVTTDKNINLLPPSEIEPFKTNPE